VMNLKGLTRFNFDLSGITSLDVLKLKHVLRKNQALFDVSALFCHVEVAKLSQVRYSRSI
jgi:hypothetical protein